MWNLTSFSSLFLHDFKKGLSMYKALHWVLGPRHQRNSRKPGWRWKEQKKWHIYLYTEKSKQNQEVMQEYDSSLLNYSRKILNLWTWGKEKKLLQLLFLQKALTFQFCLPRQLLLYYSASLTEMCATKRLISGFQKHWSRLIRTLAYYSISKLYNYFM